MKLNYFIYAGVKMVTEIFNKQGKTLTDRKNKPAC